MIGTIKRDTQLIIISVIVLTIVTLSVSYSAFFSVQSLSTIQEISTGDLNVSVNFDTTGTIFAGTEELFPTTIDEIKDKNYATLTLLNNGDLDADFSVTVSYDFDKLREISELENKTDEELATDHLVPFNYLNISIYNDTEGRWVNFAQSGETTQTAISGLTPSADYTYPVLRNSISKMSGNTTTSKVYKIYIWLSDETPTTEIGKYVYLKLNVKCAAGTETITEEVEIG